MKQQHVHIISVDSIEAKRSIVRSLIETKSCGRIFRAVNVKADGDIREYRAMIGVTRHVKGKGSTTSDKPNLLTIYDMGLASQLGEKVINNGNAPYRALNLDTVLMLGFTANGETEVFLFTDGAIGTIKDERIKASLQVAKKASQSATNVLLGILGN